MSASTTTTTTSTTEWTTDKTRSAFIDFFVSKGHTFIKSSPVLPHEDPTLLFTNAGMNQFKARFLNQHDSKSQLATVTRVSNSQKCIRAGGKHNDLDDVGKDTYHHTFFEMLGNWSFGDYYKKEAIEWAWELLTEVYKLDKERIYVSFFAGNEAEGVGMDTEARDIWLKFLPSERVLPFGMKENFWEMGATGPCGPCSEIHYDRIGGRDAASLVNADDPMVIEIWNLVFIQYNRGDDKALTLLNEKHVDTGMGLERITSILQGVHSNYDIDTFSELFTEIKKVANPQASNYQGRLGAADVDKVDMAYRVLADHIRTLTIAITDGVVPSNDGRGYVLRRVLRRAIRFGRQFFNAPIGFFHKLVPVVVKLFSGAFPELLKDPSAVMEILKDEEETFARTLDNGIKKFDQLAKKLQPGESVPPTETFKLYETFGFPFDLTQIMAEERGLTVSKEDFTEVMKKTIAEQNKKSTSIDIWKLDANALNYLRENFKPTNDSFKYNPVDVEATIVTIYDPTTKKFVDSIKIGEPCGVFFDQTNFYAEQGGQVADHGFAKSETSLIEFHDAQTYGGFVIHTGASKKVSGDIQEGDLVKKGDKFTLIINHERRQPIVSNHTATHLVNFALRSKLGNKVEQRGSYVIPERLRFDFSHGKGMTVDELQQVDDIVNENINNNLKIYDAEVPLEKAELIETLRKVPGEMYPNPVRVVSVGVPIEDLLSQPKNEEWLKFSVEFCGGTHLAATEAIRRFCISGEEAIGKGIRRITALTGEAAVTAHENVKKYNTRIQELEKLAETKPEAVSEPVKTTEKELLEIELPAASRIRFRERISKLKNIKPKKESQEEKGKAIEKFISDVGDHLTTTGDKFYVGRFDAAAGVMTVLVDIAKKINEKHQDASILLVSPDAKKATFHAKVPQSVVSSTNLKANAWASAAAVVCGGKGGGKPDTASGAGTNLDKIDEALEAAVAYVKTNLA